MTMFHGGNRALQDKYGGRAVADRIVELVETTSFTDEFQEFVESVPFFFLATSAGENTDCSFKGGAPGFVRVTAPDQLILSLIHISEPTRHTSQSRMPSCG